MSCWSGDACHLMLPFMAQGTVMAIEDGLMPALRRGASRRRDSDL
jgi:2-polyprenyl-6-methoxyphenol hydroxylase-like FAD-dependent oxidoreductase